ncbi:PREDICTED: O-acetyl-ADP-ribose deacetylase 1-like [Branchiostoma belcheri]|uniref:O-acetyl-ADP-ribose deacetylase 1-like n=1 Tax=Branchiostoma belcheri TaxID=7741 RepID=A0A6P4ZMS8_BRABE|nr:PREDICTED: O-acetyl-ADP-ribose deacetylase 1-like [Branchiostoma belcheri]
MDKFVVKKGKKRTMSGHAKMGENETKNAGLKAQERVESSKVLDSPKTKGADSSNEEYSHGTGKKRAKHAGFQLHQVRGDLFSCPETDSLVHCISQDCHMGKGIAVIFKKKFGRVEELRRQGQKPGGVAVLKTEQRYVYYLVSKEKYWQKPTYRSLESSLQAMRAHCEQHQVSRLAMPRIGCGLDRLQWERVSQMLQDIFSETDITITVYTI